MRCRTLARQLRLQGAQVLFLCRSQPGDLIALLEQEFRVLALPEKPLVSCEGLKGRELYAAWLGCSQNQDAEDCLTALASAGVCTADWLVSDHYGLDASWEVQLSSELAGVKGTPKLLAIDDLADRPHQADLLLDQNFFGEATEHRYEALLPPQCRQLLGPHYALLGMEYAQLHSLVPKRTELRRVLVFFGGVDPDNLTGRTLEALMAPELAHLAVDVVVGRQSPHLQSVADRVIERPLTTLHTPLQSLAGLISRADLAIGAGGATTWERACLALPSLVVATTANQVSFVEALHSAGHLQLLGEAATVTSQQIRSVLLARIAGPIPEDAGGHLTDGRGASRLALAMLGKQIPISLRRADPGDEALLLRWANDPHVRASSFSPNSIAPSDHHEWFRQGLAKLNRLMFVAMMADGCPIGQIRFDRQPCPATDGSFVATVDLSLDRCARGFGLAADVVRLGLQAMGQIWGSDVEAVAEVLKTNAASNACFKRAGFVQEPILPLTSLSPAVNRWRFRQDASRS